MLSNQAVLSWSAATDVQQTNGLTYNLRVGVSPGGGEIVSPLADSATGLRRVPTRGNADQSLSRIVRGLAPGTYYWSVQAIDNSYVGSAFAPEASFVVPQAGGAPTITLSTVRADGSFELQFTAVPDRSYAIEVSPDLQSWTGVRTNLASEASLTFTDSEVPRPTQRFYRVRLLP